MPEINRRQAMVPSRLQYVAETGYGFVRNGMGRDIIGSAQFMRYVPYLFARTHGLRATRQVAEHLSEELGF